MRMRAFFLVLTGVALVELSCGSSGDGGQCSAAGNDCTESPDSCCAGTVCAGPLTSLTASCMQMCNAHADCGSGCCQVLSNSTEKVCADASACDTTGGTGGTAGTGGTSGTGGVGCAEPCGSTCCGSGSVCVNDVCELRCDSNSACPSAKPCCEALVLGGGYCAVADIYSICLCATGSDCGGLAPPNNGACAPEIDVITNSMSGRYQCVPDDAAPYHGCTTGCCGSGYDCRGDAQGNLFCAPPGCSVDADCGNVGVICCKPSTCNNCVSSCNGGPGTCVPC